MLTPTLEAALGTNSLEGGLTASIRTANIRAFGPASALKESILRVRFTGVHPAGCLPPAPSVTAKGWTQVLCPPAGGGEAKQETGGHPGKWLLRRGSQDRLSGEGREQVQDMTVCRHLC